ncbi:MAG TPA: hypothetical protein VFS97_05260 [Nitrososphaeraceae archaeon]|nr:hypothetical protein [Nitrososphaeraceae archaeon]
MMAGTLLITTAITTIVPPAYAYNKVTAEDESIAQLNDCDDNELDGNADVNGDFCGTIATLGPFP